MPAEVQYERLRPGQIVAARQACPVAYLPLGTLEWHGRHGPVGNDGLTAHEMAVRCALAGGGLVFPTMWYGESRVEGLMDANAPDRERIAAEMALPAENFAPAGYRFDAQQQIENYQRLLSHALCELQSLGFKVVVLVAGHFPLVDHARAACSLYHQARWNNRRAAAITWVFTGYELITDVFPSTADHAGYWETCMMLALHPELVDLNEQPADPSTPPIGVYTSRPVREATAEVGEKMLALIVERVIAQVSDRLRDPKAYYAHGVRF